MTARVDALHGATGNGSRGWLADRRVGSAVSNAVLGTALYIGTAVMLFGGLISAALVLRAGTAAWPASDPGRLPVAVTGANLLVLLASGGLVWWAQRTPVRGRRRRVLDAGAVLGAVFLGVQGAEWVQMLAHGLRMSSGPYAAVFYTLVGAHAVHALGGLAVLFVTAYRVRRGAGDVAACALYWGFVVLLWPVIYVLVYMP